MAATTISHNRPTAGSITWTAFNIAYDGANFTVPAGTTAAKFVWWVYNAGAPKLMTGDILPDLTADDTVLFLNKQGIGQLLPESTVVDGSLIVEESIYAQAIAADQIASRHIMSDAITTEHLSSNSVTAEQLSVGTVSANLVANGSFEDYDDDGNVVGWEVLSMQGGTIAPVTGVSSSGAIAVQMNATATSALLRLAQKSDMFIPVSNASARRWYISARMGVGTAITKGAYLRAVWYDASKKRLASGDYVDVRSNGSLTTTFSVYEGQVTPPALARYMGIEVILTAPNVATKLYVDEVNVNEVVVSALIADGAITASKVQAKAITADKMTITDSTNLLTDPGLEAGGSGWNMGAAGSIVTVPTANIRSGSVGTKALQLTANGTLRELVTDAMGAEAGEWYYASCWVRAATVSTSTGQVGLAATVNRQGLAAMWPTFQSVAANTITTAWRKLEGSIQLPAATTTFSLRPNVQTAVASGVFQFDDFTLRRMNGGELIVDGQIKTDHMTANTISGSVIAANTIVGSKLEADSITARELLASEIWGNEAWITAINGKTITGATVRTAASGARLEMTKTGLKGYDSKGAVYLDASNGSLAMEGELSVSTTTTAGKKLQTTVGITSTNFGGTSQSVPGIELSENYEGLGVPTGYRPAVITTPNGVALQMISGTPGGNSTVIRGKSTIELNEGNVYLTQENHESGKGVHSNGAYSQNYNGTPKRIPLGILERWEHSVAVNLTINTQICSHKLWIPAFATIKVSVVVGGYGNVHNQYMDIRLTVDGAGAGRHVHHAQTAWTSSDLTADFYFTSTVAYDKYFTFRVAGNAVEPSPSTFIMVGRGGDGPTSHVVYQDLGSVYTSADLITQR